MADGLILEFEGFGADTYKRVNDALGIDPVSGEGDWPDGLVTHVGAEQDGAFVVFEVWRSQADQERFMAERLMPALQANDVSSPPKRADWLDLAGHHHRPDQG